jgi:hypothetical protein
MPLNRIVTTSDALLTCVVTLAARNRELKEQLVEITKRKLRKRKQI